jgi:hypothetical protein
MKSIKDKINKYALLRDLGKRERCIGGDWVWMYSDIISWDSIGRSLYQRIKTNEINKR